MNLTVLFVGLGSIGKRHLSNLSNYCENKGITLEVDALRSGNKNTVKSIDGVNMFSEWEELSAHYSLIFITNPTNLHEETLERLKDKGDYFFLEKPVFQKSIALESFEKIIERTYVAAPLRYKKVMQDFREMLVAEEIHSSRVICSTYLPDWRETDYRESYSSYSNRGGGVELDCIHEMDYIVELFGFPLNISKIFGQKSNLEIHSNDVAIYILEYENQFVEVHLDYFGKFSQRNIEVITSEGKITMDLLKNEITVTDKVQAIKDDENINKMYEREMAYFLEEVIKDKDNWNNLFHANEVLKLAES